MRHVRRQDGRTRRWLRHVHLLLLVGMFSPLLLSHTAHHVWRFSHPSHHVSSHREHRLSNNMYVKQQKHKEETRNLKNLIDLALLNARQNNRGKLTAQRIISNPRMQHSDNFEIHTYRPPDDYKNRSPFPNESQILEDSSFPVYYNYAEHHRALLLPSVY